MGDAENDDGIVRDFHMHTIYSDGICTPTELAGLLVENGVTEFSLTDHNTTVGIEEMAKLARLRGMKFVPGIEVNALFKDRNAHILGYGFDLQAIDGTQLADLIEVNKNYCWDHLQQIIRLSQKDPIIARKPTGEKVEFSLYPDDFGDFDKSSLGYFHAALILKRKFEKELADFPELHASHIRRSLFSHKSGEITDETFRKLAKYGIEDKQYWKVPWDKSIYPNSDEVINILHTLGAYAVIAHPSEHRLKADDLAELAFQGLDGVEVYTTKHDVDEMRMYGEIASELELFITSGSDFHDEWNGYAKRPGHDRYSNRLTKGVDADFLNRKE